MSTGIYHDKGVMYVDLYFIHLTVGLHIYVFAVLVVWCWVMPVSTFSALVFRAFL